MTFIVGNKANLSNRSNSIFFLLGMGAGNVHMQQGLSKQGSGENLLFQGQVSTDFYREIV